jgi:Domain of unknown function (DUF1851)
MRSQPLSHGRGLVLKPEQVYDFVPPPVLGGGFDVDHIVATDFVVALNIAGQLHRQVKDLPPGTQISGLTIDSEPPSTAAGAAGDIIPVALGDDGLVPRPEPPRFSGQTVPSIRLEIPRSQAALRTVLSCRCRSPLSSRT